MMRRITLFFADTFLGCAVFAANPSIARNLSLPDLSLTPGKATSLSLSEICHTKWSTGARHVSAAMKRIVFQSYGLPAMTIRHVSRTRTADIAK